LETTTSPTLPCRVERDGGWRGHGGDTLRFVLREVRPILFKVQYVPYLHCDCFLTVYRV